jgi:hypothetical protein
MGTLFHHSQPVCAPTLHYYRATPKARLPGIADAIHDRSLYLYDILALCLRGAWDMELRQFMPPASLQDSVSLLLDLGLIEDVGDPPPPPVMERPHRLQGLCPANLPFNRATAGCPASSSSAFFNDARARSVSPVTA